MSLKKPRRVVVLQQAKDRTFSVFTNNVSDNLVFDSRRYTKIAKPYQSMDTGVRSKWCSAYTAFSDTDLFDMAVLPDDLKASTPIESLFI